MNDAVKIGLLGCGNVGAAVVRMLHEHGDEIAARFGLPLEIARVAVRDPTKHRGLPLPSHAITDDAYEVVIDPDIDIVVEVMGGVEPARSLILEAFARGKSVVTANKELLSRHSGELFDAANVHGVDLLYEASVGGGIPLIRPLSEHLAGDRIALFMGIVNGTTNYILTRMSEEGASLEDAVAEAKEFGYAEADPAADLEGHDAAAKAAILATIAFHVPVTADDVYREGIMAVSGEDIAFAKQLGYVVKLLAIGEAVGGEVSVRVYPAMIPADHPLAAVRESFNAVYVEGEKVGPLMLYGRGAGGDPTATSVVGDIIEVARNRLAGVRSTGGPLVGRTVKTMGPAPRIKPIAETAAQYYILMSVVDRPGVLAAVATAFAEHEVSIKSVWQEGHGDEAQLVLITHRNLEGALQACVDSLRGLDVVESVDSVLRVEAAEP